MKGAGIFIISEDLTRLNNHAVAWVREKSSDEVEHAWSHNGKILYEDKMVEIWEGRFNDVFIDMNWSDKTDSVHTKNEDIDTVESEKKIYRTKQLGVSLKLHHHWCWLII